MHGLIHDSLLLNNVIGHMVAGPMHHVVHGIGFEMVGRGY